LLKDLSVRLTSRIILGADEKHSNVSYPIGCFHGAWPRSRGAANQYDELAAFHCSLEAQDKTSSG
jgi:hypothetical protein